MAAFSWALVASAQVPVPPPAESPPAAEGAASPATPPPPPAPVEAAPPPAPAPPPRQAEAPPASEVEPSPVPPPRPRARVELPRDFVLQQSPWVDFSLTNFWIEERASNFLNVGVQVGGYFVERLRVSARLVAPLEEPEDDYHDYGTRYFGSDPPSARSVSLLYGGSLGLILSNSRTFLFAPGLLIMRADVNAYGTAAALALPFEWTTARHLRVGFELAIGHAFGGTAYSAEGEKLARPGGTAIFLQFQMGWSMGHL